MSILVTGGAGYIGSHTLIELIEAGFEPIILDDFSNSSKEVIQRIKLITGYQPAYVEGNILDRTCLDRIFTDFEIDSVIHFAAFKAVGESVQNPLKYYKNNVTGTLSLLEAMQDHGVKKIVFSSSATVYGNSHPSPLNEIMEVGKATNPYGYTKIVMEQILMDLAKADSDWQITLLRYFNPIGAHESGLIGENPHGIPNNLMPYVTQVAIGKRDQLSIFGDDYDTPDGTGVRDYIHVVDLARGHVKAIQALDQQEGLAIYNLGTGHGVSVLDLVQTFARVNQVDIPYQIVGRRPGDIAICFADPTKAQAILGWQAEHDLERMCRDSWNWQKKNPDGY